MARKRVLITGGAGFIGSHLADELLGHGYRVRVLDALVPRRHGDDRTRPAYLARDVELLRGDVRDRRVMERALRRVDAVFHLAPESSSLNDFGTAVLLESLTRKPVEKLVFASSMDVYGEGLYRTAGAASSSACHRCRERSRVKSTSPEDLLLANIDVFPLADRR